MIEEEKCLVKEKGGEEKIDTMENDDDDEDEEEKTPVTCRSLQLPHLVRQP